MKKILIPHPKKQSRKVEEKDIEIVLKDSEDLYRICFEPIGKHSGALAMAHVQIEADNPLRFFVKKEGIIIINPKIVSYSQEYTHTEGCMSFPFRDIKKIRRWNIIKVEYFNKKMELIKEQVSGINAAIFQHEIDHFNLNLLF